jgi:hypothetical protein
MMRAMTKTITAGFAALALGLFAVGCGDDDKSSEGGESEGAKTACKADALSGSTGLPAGFPVPGELTLTKTRKDGPTTVVDGYWEASIQEVHDEYKQQIEAAGYQVLFDEVEEHDSEISYKGEGKTGQVAIREDCTEDGTMAVHITNRPA